MRTPETCPKKIRGPMERRGPDKPRIVICGQVGEIIGGAFECGLTEAACARCCEHDDTDNAITRKATHNILRGRMTCGEDIAYATVPKMGIQTAADMLKADFGDSQDYIVALIEVAVDRGKMTLERAAEVEFALQGVSAQ